MGKKILCTGGLGYIGIHTAVHLEKVGYECTIVDNLVNASEEALPRLNAIVGKTVPFKKIDLRDYDALLKLMKETSFDGIIHYAALKAVGESCEKPLEYYENNVTSLLNLLKAMRETGVKTLVFSSSATVYKASDQRLTEDSEICGSNPYGQTKIMAEQILKDVCAADPTLKVSVLRYFNPVGAHPSGTIGESPDYPLNLLPYIQQVAVGRREHLVVFGNDWPTDDGTGVRDYIHVEDVAEGHIAALAKLDQLTKGSYLVHNLGTGKGTSVLELVREFEATSGVTIPYKFSQRRQGDLAHAVADPSKAVQELNWSAGRSIREACASAWKWQKSNPMGYPQKTDTPTNQ